MLVSKCTEGQAWLRLTSLSCHGALKVCPGYLLFICRLKSEIKSGQTKRIFARVGSDGLLLNTVGHQLFSKLQPFAGYMYVLPTDPLHAVQTYTLQVSQGWDPS